MRRWVPRLLAATGMVLVVALGPAPPASAQDGRPRVLRAALDGPVTPVMAEHVDAALDAAERGGHDALLLTVDTPGGLDTSMRDIVRRVLSARVPVVAYVSPQGARAASAGAIITFAAHVAAMAPGTAIGAATPIELEDGGDSARKVVNDAAAYAEALARLRGRDVGFAVDTVREGRSASSAEAVAVGAVDLEASSVGDLLAAVDGRTVAMGGVPAQRVLRTAGADVEAFDMTLLRRVRQLLADPNLAFLFLSLGTLGIVYELASPGIGAGGAVGAVLILLAMFSLSVLPVNAVGLLLLAVAAACFVAELFAPGVGVAAAGGTIALVLSGVFLFEDAPGLETSVGVVAPVAAVVGGAVVLAGRLVVRSRRAPPTTTGTAALVGRAVVVGTADGARGQAFVEGAWWALRSTGGGLSPGQEARVVEVDGLDLVVEPVTAPPSGDQTTGAS